MSRHTLISLIIYSLAGTTNLICAFVCEVSIWSVVAAWVCYLLFAALIVMQQITIKRMQDQQKLERKIFFDFFNHSIKSTKEQNDDLQRDIEQD